MPALPLHSFPAFLDLLGLVTVLGVLACRLWVLTRDEALEVRKIDAAAWIRLRRLLGWALALITVTSFPLLAARALQMSKQPLDALPTVLPTVLLRTHYGTVWFVRMGALAGLWLGRWALEQTERAVVPASMFGAAAVIAWSYSATGHAADWGDFTWTEWMHWLHVLSAALLAGGLFAPILALSPVLVPRSGAHMLFIGKTMRRLSTVATTALIGVLATGVFNAVVQLGGVQALWESDYGRLLSFKLLLVLAMIVLWLFNRFAVVPALRGWLGGFRGVYGTNAPARPSGSGKSSVGQLMLWHRRSMIVAAALLAAVLLCAVLLAFNMPPRRHAMMMHAQIGEKRQVSCCYLPEGVGNNRPAAA